MRIGIKGFAEEREALQSYRREQGLKSEHIRNLSSKIHVVLKQKLIQTARTE
jgi:hypothetical protein